MWLVLGGSKGLGKEIVHLLQEKSAVESLSRKNGFDFSKSELWPESILKMQKLCPQKIVYCAGGGPFGNYQDIHFSSHQWAWQVNFIFPAYLLHQVLQNQENWPDLRQICFIGSAIAESKPDAKASSYASAKHALKGLIESVQLENSQTKIDLRLFSPGYMDTQMLPKNAWPRQSEGLVKSPGLVAEFLMSWLENTEFKNKHLVFE